MERLRTKAWVWAVVCCASVWGVGVRGQTPGVYDFDADWRMHVGEVAGGEAAGTETRDWKPVTLPHAFNEDDAFKKDISELSTGISWYRKTFVLDEAAAAKKVFLEFEGVRHAARVWVNGKPVALSENGVMAFGADVSGVVKPGENVVAVRCDNAWNYKEEKTGSNYQWNDRNFYANYGGINKHVKLHVKERVYQTLPLYSSLGTTGVYVYARDFDFAGRAATVVAESEVRNEGDGTPKDEKAQRVDYEVIVRDLEGKELGRVGMTGTEIPAGTTQTLSASIRLGGLNFWSWGYGYLYEVETVVKVGGKVVDSVVTRTGFRKLEFGGGVVKLNGRVLQVKGYAQRTTNEWPALGIDVPAWVSDFSNGLMVESGANLVRWMHVTPSRQDVESCDRVGLMQELPAGDSERDATGRKWEQRIELMRDAMIYNRNSPSVMCYEAGNKGVSEEHMREMVALRDKWDPHGGRAMGSREMLGSKVAEWGGEMLYINKSADKPVWATEYSRDEALRKYADELTPPYHKDGDGPQHKGESAAAYNRNQDSMAIETVKRWYDYWRERPGTGKRVSAGGLNIVFSDSNTHHRGAENYRRSGEVDAMRILKEGWFVHQVMWDGWVEVERPRAHIIGHWNYAPGTVKDVTVVSSAEKVELLLNGKSLGYGEQSSRFLFTFPKVKWEPGKLVAAAYDAAGNKVCEAEVETAGEPVALKLSPRVNPRGFRADGADLALVDVEVVDAAGRRVPTAFNPVEFVVEGPGEWRGGIAQGEGNCILSKTLPVELGVNRVSVRSTTEPGVIVVHASSPGLKAAEVRLETKSVAMKGGLSALPDVPPPLLSRGPTPARDAVVVRRTALEVASVSAGSEAESANNAIDDNEETTWTSKGGLAEAWIKFELKSPEVVSELTMRLGSWRSRSYPIRILVDDQEVYAGATPRSLGYVTIPVKPTKGKTVTVQLIGAPRDRDDFDLTEITGMKMQAGRDGGGKGVLAIVELEIYGPAK